MSWFDTSGIANIAKSALKEAQRTIDKALDIKDDGNITAPGNTPVDTNFDDFFGTWGVPHTTTNVGGSGGNEKKEDAEDAVTQSPAKNKLATSIWGSFTGSFFDPYAKENAKAQTRDSVDSLDDSIDIGAHFSGSKLVVHDDSDVSFSRMTSCETEDETIEKESFEIGAGDIAVKKREKSAVSINNRLSVISMESDRKSSESVEILSGSTGSATSPDSEAISVSSSVLGSKPNSESVEVLPNSLTSPSSVEVIGSDSNSNQHHSQNTDEFISPLQSPLESCEKLLMTPDSVEVIPEDFDENSIADDTISYNSISESTAATVLEGFNLHLKQKTLTLVKSENMVESISSDVTLSPDKSVEVPITRAPSRSGMHLPLQMNLIDTQPQSTKEDLTNVIRTSNIIDIPENEGEGDIKCMSETDDSSISEKTMIAESGMESSSDTSTTTESNTNSIYLKSMLAEAMTEKRELEILDLTQSMLDSSHKSGSSEQLENISIVQLDMPPRETSPISSESRSDLVKIGSDHTSGHTSGDDLETTTSSDIEIISSPNGDSSSTHSRHSPAKSISNKIKDDANIDHLLGKMTFKKMKGHNRELSGASSMSDDNEMEHLIKRLSEMTEILECRESKLSEFSRKHAELQEVNNDLRKQLDIFVNKQSETDDLSQVTEEYTQRLSALERKFQQAIRDKDSLRKQLEQCKSENVTRVSRSEMDGLMEEKNQLIKELREEGEKLSKQQLQHSNIIKKLRAKEKEHDGLIKQLKETVEDLSTETERLKRSLTAKEEVERSQIEAVHQLTSKNKKIEYELNQLQGNYDDLTQKHDTTKKSLDAAKKELIDKSKTSSELVQREQMLQSLENEKKMTESQNEEIINQLEDLRAKLREVNEEYLKKEQVLRLENTELMRRLEDAESRNEELAQAGLEVTKPLVRQLEALQSTHNAKLASFEKIETGFTIKLNEVQSKLNYVSESERAIREEYLTVKMKMDSVENQIGSALHENEVLKMQIDQQKAERMLHEQELNKDVDDLQQKLKNECSIVENLQKEIELLQHNLLEEKCVIETERKRNISLQEQVRDKQDSSTTGRSTPPNFGNVSPTPSIGKVSLSDSFNSLLWQQDDAFDVNMSSKCTNMLEMQYLQSNLKHRDGEVQQLQWELKRREHERTMLNTEISNLLTRVEELETKCSDLELIKKELSDLQQQYETLCQLYGEKVEETEELKLDLLDVKEMYKGQIDELLKQQGATTSNST